MVDWAEADGRCYGYWAPLAAVVAMPFVAAFGLGVSDQLINVLFGALNVGLFYWLLRRVGRIGLVTMDESCRVALTLLLAFGTSHFWLTCAAQVWFAVHIVTLTAMLAAMIAATSRGNTARSYLVSGAFFGVAILGRNVVILSGLFFVVLIWLRSDGALAARCRAAALRVALFCLPVAAAVGLQGAYNQARFGSAFESGLGIQVTTGGQKRFVEPYQQYGAFSLHYVPHNLKYYLWNVAFPRRGDGRIWFDSEGNSIFLVTPPMLYALLLWRRWNRMTVALLCGVVPLVCSLLAYLGTGYVQFGPRHLLDVMPLLLLLVAGGMRGRVTPVSYVLIVLAVAANLFGTYRMCDEQFAPLEDWITVYTLPVLVAVALLAGSLALRLRRRTEGTLPD